MPAPTKRPPPRESIMLAILFIVAGVVATGVAIPAATSTPPAGGYGWKPWVPVGIGVLGLLIAFLERTPAIDPKASVKANAMVALFGPVGSRIAYAVVGGAFLGGGIGLLVA